MDKAEKKSNLFGLLGRNISYSFSRGYFADNFVEYSDDQQKVKNETMNQK